MEEIKKTFGVGGMKKLIGLFFLCVSSSSHLFGKAPLPESEIMPNYGLQNKDRIGGSLEISYIYWRVSEEGLDSGAANVAKQPVYSNNQLVDKETYGILDRCSSGFKVGLGSDFRYDGWELDLLYTNFHSNYNPPVELSADCDPTLAPSKGPYYGISQGNFSVKDQSIPVVTSLLFNNIVSEVYSVWRLRFNTIDLTLSKTFFVSPKLLCTPTIGLKGAWIKQSWIQKYLNRGNGINIGGSSTSQTYALLNPTYSSSDYSYQNLKENYRITSEQWSGGIGPRFGFETAWIVIDEITLFVDVYGTTLCGYFKDTRKDTSKILNSSDEILIDNYTAVATRADAHLITPVIESLLGIRYDAFFCDQKYRFRMQLGFENQLWFEQNHLIGNYLTEPMGGDLTFMGLNFMVRFDF